MSTMKLHDKWKASSDAGTVFEWMKWVKEIPFIPFRDGWEIKVTPPFGAAVTRFAIRDGGSPDGERVSVYLDCYDALGSFGEPYWEVYPHEGDVYRCKMADVDDLLDAIATSLGEISND